jgi:hypothetical protein
MPAKRLLSVVFTLEQFRQFARDINIPHSGLQTEKSSRIKRRNEMLLLIIVLILLFGGGGGYYGFSRWGRGGGLGVVGTVLLIVLIVYLLGGLH